MQNTSQIWKDLWASDEAILEARAIIAGTVYTDLPTAPVVNRALMQNGLSIGNAVSATCQLSVRTDDAIPKSAEVVIQYRLTDGTTSSEWLTAGTFYISHRQKNPVTGVLSLTCYDALLKANMPMPSTMPWTNEDGEVITTETDEWIYFTANYPRSMATVLNDLLLVLGLELDPETQISTDSIYVVNDVSAGTTINNVLCKIAAAHGGNWIITPAGRLKLVPVVSAAGADEATENVVDVDGIVGSIGTSNTGTITGIRYDDNEGSHVVGSEDGLVIDANVSASVAEALLTQLNGMTYQAYDLQGAVYDPAAELGDYVRAGEDGEIRAVLCAETSVYGPDYRGDISAPEIGEMADEYPYKGASKTALEQAMNYAETAAQEAANALDRTLTQQEVFDRLTDGGAEQGIALEPATNPGPSASTPKRVVLNLDYARFGKLVADFIHGGTLTLGGLNNVSGILRLLDSDGNEIGKLNSGGLEMTRGSIDIPLDSVPQGNQNVTINKDGYPLKSRYVSYYGDVYETTIGRFGFYCNNVTRDNTIQIDDSSISIIATNPEENYPFIGVYDDSDPSNERAVRIAPDELFIWNNNARSFIRCEGTSHISGDFVVGGTKSRTVRTDQYSDRLLYCYETPSPLFGDVGEGKIGEDGKCYVWLDPVFAQTITTTQYQVFLQRYGSSECWVAERKGSYFVVEGTPGMAFGWELKAKQRDYDQRRLERNDEPFIIPTQTYGADAAKHLQDLKKARIAE